MSQPQLHGKWVVLVDTEEEETHIKTTDKSFFSAARELSVACS